MSKNNGIVHSAITRQILEKKIKRRVSAAALGDALGGRPDVAMAIEAVLKEKDLPKSAAALIKAYKSAQAEMDMEYSLHYPE